jgi:uncharacterized membrane protein YkoI
MRTLWMTMWLAAISLLIGCSESAAERKNPIALDKVPHEIIKIAQEEFPDLVFDSAFTETEDGQPVFELKGKEKSGKIREVEVTKDGKILNL